MKLGDEANKFEEIFMSLKQLELHLVSNGVLHDHICTLKSYFWGCVKSWIGSKLEARRAAKSWLQVLCMSLVEKYLRSEIIKIE